MSTTSTILDYDEDDLLAFVDRRVGGPDHSPIWDLNDQPDIFGTQARQRGRQQDIFKGGRGKQSGQGGAGPGGSANRNRLRTALTAKNGQAVVKVISYGRGRESARNQLNYISRRGDLALEARDGTLVDGGDAIEELAKDWVVDFDTKANSRNLVHLMLSAPAGTDRDAAHESVKDFAKIVFAENHDYVLVRHEDTDNPHTHVLVKMRGDDGMKLDPRKAELKAWREAYARCAARQGIKLDASSRRSRGQGKKGQKMAVVKLKERGEASYAEKATAIEVLENPNKDHPADIAANASFELERREFAKLGLALKELTGREDETGERARALLARVHGHATAMTPPVGMRAEFRAIMQNSGARTPEELIGRREGGAKPKSTPGAHPSQART